MCKNRLQIIYLVILAFSFELFGKHAEIGLNSKVRSVYQAIVRIEVVSEKGAGGRMMKSRSTGSGVIISRDGLVLTNHHVAGKASRLSCRLHDGEEIMADLLGADAMTDLALLRLRLSDRKYSSKPLTIAEFGNSEQVKVGDICFAMGSPAGLSQSVTKGIISNVALISQNTRSFRLDGERVGELVRWLGHDAVIYPGNSGGPLVNEQGQIIGINEVGIGSLGGAIPSNLSQSVAKKLESQGYVSRSWIGLESQPLIDESEPGILVSGVITGSPAEKAGLRAGDLITRYDGKKVSARIPEEIPIFNQFVSSRPINKNVKAVGLRDGSQKVWNITPIPREPAFAKERELKSWGLTIRNFTLMSSLEAQRKNKLGVQVHSTNQGGPSASAKPALSPGDVIISVNGISVHSDQDLFETSRKLTRGKTEATPVLVSFERNLSELLTVIKIGPEAEENQPVQAWKPWLGISTQVLTRELSSALNLPVNTRGVRVAQVFPNTPAEKSGLKSGDLIFRIDGQVIQAHRVEDAEVFGNMIKQYKIDSTIELSVFRDNREIKLSAALEKRPIPPNELPKYEEETFEFTLRELSFGDRVNRRLDLNQTGLVIENVEPAGWGALAGLRQGDLLLKVEDQSVGTVHRFEKRMNQIISQRPKKMIFFVRRGIHTLFLELEPDWNQED
ncbi:MAG: PDZ domain-containing protein [Verrucomicrobiota bacterium]|nr:PDZ domain-containing protein [Verrucomicrobiota bacterium]